MRCMEAEKPAPFQPQQLLVTFRIGTLRYHSRVGNCCISLDVSRRQKVAQNRELQDQVTSNR